VLLRQRGSARVAGTVARDDAVATSGARSNEGTLPPVSTIARVFVSVKFCG
jgi:hypothetical protein